MSVRSTNPLSDPFVWPRLSLRGILDRIAAVDARHRQRLALTQLDDHMLRDIGVTRADVADELRRPIPSWVFLP